MSTKSQVRLIETGERAYIEKYNVSYHIIFWGQSANVFKANSIKCQTKLRNSVCRYTVAYGCAYDIVHALPLHSIEAQILT